MVESSTGGGKSNSMQVTGDDDDQEEALLKKAKALLAEVIPSTDSAIVKSFHGRWLTIHRKLCQLYALLTEHNPLSSTAATNLDKPNSLWKDLLFAILATAAEAKELASQSGDGGGKLQTQSNLDSLSLKLSLHKDDIEILVNTTMSNNYSSSSSSSSSVGEVGLLARLQVGSLELRQVALGEVIELMESDGKHLVNLGAVAIPTLVQLLDSSVICMREKAASAVCLLAQSSSCEKRLIVQGAMAPLLRLLESGTALAKEKSAGALYGLTLTTENSRALVAQGGISALVEICHCGTPIAQASSAGVLNNLASIADLQPSLAEEDTIPAMICLITSGTALAQEFAARCLQSMASHNEKFRLLIANAGGIQALLAYYDGASTTTAKAQELSILALTKISISKVLTNELLHQEFLRRLINALHNSPPFVQQAAAGAVSELATLSVETRRLLGELGFLFPLVIMLDAKIGGLQDVAAQALYNLLLFESNRRQFCKEERGIWGLVQLLDPGNTGVSMKYSILILLDLSKCRKQRKRMMASGATSHLQRLSATGVKGAQKLLERLEGRRIWTVFRL